MSATLELPALITSGNKNNQVRAFIMTWPGQDKNTNITADFVPGRNLSSISQELYKIKWPRVNVQKNSFKNSKHQTKFRCSGALDTTFDTQARQLLEVGNTACERRDIQNHISGDFVWFLYLIRICVWPLEEHESDITSSYLSRARSGQAEVFTISTISAAEGPLNPAQWLISLFVSKPEVFSSYKPQNLRTENAKSLSHTHRFLLEAIIPG